MEELVKFLENVGVGNETIALLKDPEDGQKTEDLSDEFKSKQREVYANDPEVIRELQKNAKGKERGSVERKIKKVFGITPEEWGESELEGDYEKALTFGFDKQKKAGSKSAQEIQAELLDANKKIEWYKEEEVPRIVNAEKQKVDNFHIERHLRELIVDSGELANNIGSDVAEIVLKEELRKKGLTTSLVENKLAILTEDGLVPLDEAKTKNLSNAEIVKSIVVAKGLIKQSNAGDPDPKLKPSVLPTRDTGKGNVHPDAIKNIEKLKDMNTSGNILAGK